MPNGGNSFRLGGLHIIYDGLRKYLLVKELYESSKCNSFKEIQSLKFKKNYTMREPNFKPSIKFENLCRNMNN